MIQEEIIKFHAYYSDPHFEHENIIKYCDRPFGDSKEMVDELIRRYNEVVRENQNVLWVGDCYFKNRGKEILDSLNGNKYLLRGNHDKRKKDKEFLSFGFKEVYKEHFLSSLDEYDVRFSHYPHFGFSLDKRYENLRPPIEDSVVLIHGHCHAKEKRTWMNTVHVGVDAWDFRPALRAEVKAIIAEIKSEIPI